MNQFLGEVDARGKLQILGQPSESGKHGAEECGAGADLVQPGVPHAADSIRARKR